MSLIANSQLLDNKRGNAFTEKPFFNQDFIRLNKLKSLQGEYTYKKQGDIMRKTQYTYIYRFDKEGRLIFTFETRKDDHTVDTTWNFYDYYPNNLLKVHRKSNDGGFTSIHYTYDSLNRITSEEYHRDVLDSTGNVIKSIVFNRETMKYYATPRQQKKIVYNSYDLPYKEEFQYFDEDGYLVSKEELLKMTSGKIKYTYEYNEKGLLKAIRSASDHTGKFEEEYLFRYDDLGNLVEKHVYKNGEFTTDIQILYNDKTKLLSAVLTREVRTNFIMILRFMDYEFHPFQE